MVGGQPAEVGVPVGVAGEVVADGVELGLLGGAAGVEGVGVGAGVGVHPLTRSATAMPAAARTAMGESRVDMTQS